MSQQQIQVESNVGQAKEAAISLGRGPCSGPKLTDNYVA